MVDCGNFSDPTVIVFSAMDLLVFSDTDLNLALYTCMRYCTVMCTSVSAISELYDAVFLSNEFSINNPSIIAFPFNSLNCFLSRLKPIATKPPLSGQPNSTVITISSAVPAQNQGDCFTMLENAKAILCGISIFLACLHDSALKLTFVKSFIHQ